MAPVRTLRNILMELRKVCQHPYLSAPELENEDAPEAEQHKQLVEGCGKLSFLKLLLPKLKQRGHRVLLFSQFKIALDRIEDFLYGEGYKFLRLDGDVQQAQRQKSMDAFNAPDSEYFIFLLTTRAGGVGINLATADTVIVYDPDFNPHMDLQAIARSHRYGQTKKVLVFKLMTKNSVEEQIILNGKKKMVLDHLVVQQMGKENEEGDIDNMLLHGAAALYDTNEDGFSASDIRYTSRDVDLLIDKVESDAAAEAKEMEERERRKENGGEEQNGENGDVIAKPKETMSFAFAKIWEADGNRLEELSDVEEDSPEDEANTWRIVMENVEKARQAALLAEQGQRAAKRQAAAVAAQQKLELAQRNGNTTDDAKSRKGKGKKRKSAAQSSSDTEFAINPDEVESESEGEIGFDDRYELLDDPGKAVVRGVAVNIGPLTEEQARRLQEKQARKALRKAANGSTPNTETSTPGPSTTSNGKKRRSEESPARKAAKALAAGAASGSTSQAGPFTTQASNPPPNPNSPLSPLDPETLRYGRNVMMWLYDRIAGTGFPYITHDWGKVTLLEVDPVTRVQAYQKVARHADHRLTLTGHAVFFMQPQVLSIIVRMIYEGHNLVPEVQTPALDSTVQTQPPPSPQLRSAPVQQSDSHLPSPYNSPRPGPVEKTPVAPLPAQPERIAQPASSKDATPVTEPKPKRKRAPNATVANKVLALLEKEGEVTRKCTWCQSEDHSLPQCGSKPDVMHLKSIRRAMIEGNEDEETKRKGLEQVDQLLAMLEPAQSSSSSAPKPSTPQALVRRQASNGTRDSAIVIDDGEDTDDRLVKRAKVLHDNAAAPSAQRGRPKTFHGCVICGAKQSHPAASCPRVTAGPESIHQAMSQFSPNEPIWNVLKTLLERAIPQSQSQSQSQSLSRSQPQPGAARTPAATAPTTNTASTPCPFCGKVCGRSIRACATSDLGEIGGRKALKARIRKLEDGSHVPPGAPTGGSISQVLFNAYLEWPKASSA